MIHSRWTLRCAAVAAVGLAAGTVTAAPAGVAFARSNAVKPEAKLITAQSRITAQRFGKFVFVDPGVYVTALGAPLRFNVSRPDYQTHMTITQVIEVPGGKSRQRTLPASALSGWAGLRRF